MEALWALTHFRGGFISFFSSCFVLIKGCVIDMLLLYIENTSVNLNYLCGKKRVVVDDGSINSPVQISLENSVPWRQSLRLGVEAPNPSTALLPDKKVLQTWAVGAPQINPTQTAKLAVLASYLADITSVEIKINVLVPVPISSHPHTLGTLKFRVSLLSVFHRIGHQTHPWHLFTSHCFLLYLYGDKCSSISFENTRY